MSIRPLPPHLAVAPVLLAGLALLGALPGCTRVRAAAPAPAEMVRIPGGTFRMGTDRGLPYEAPAHPVTVRPFYLDVHEVTNAQFRRFVEVTGYRTVAERWGWSGVFSFRTHGWEKRDGADWRHPEGAGSEIRGKDRYPVVQVAWEDAVAYARWAGKRLPTEAEWERAARGGLEGKTYVWGDDLTPGGKYQANFWQGPFPKRDEGGDGYRGLAPVCRFPPNGYGLYDMAGNAWEWVADWFNPAYYRVSPTDSPTGPDAGTERVIRGGSFLCAECYCRGYRVAARNKTTPDSATNHMGFRCARDLTAP